MCVLNIGNHVSVCVCPGLCVLSEHYHDSVCMWTVCVPYQMLDTRHHTVFSLLVTIY